MAHKAKVSKCGVEAKADGAVKARVQKHRDQRRQAGLRLVQIWLPDRRAKGFTKECHRQALVVAASDRTDTSLSSFLDQAVVDLGGWTP